jgi:hypothetical protein
MEIINFFGLISVVLLFTKYFQPIQPAKNKLVEWIIKKSIKLGMKWKPFFKLTEITKLLTCPKCLSFWSILVITHSLPLSAIGAILTMVIDNILEYPQNPPLIK